jgi:DNA-binding GntR family transcriptional regulator
MDDQMRIAYDYALALDAEIGAIEPGLIVEWVRLNARLDRYIAALSGNPTLLRAMNGNNLDVNDMLDRPAGKI